MIDGLHEDLNRIKKKPSFEIPDFIGYSDDEKATFEWKKHLLRD